jgi:hypothetical protein
VPAEAEYREPRPRPERPEAERLRVALVAVGADAEVCNGTAIRWAVRCTMGNEPLLSLNTVSKHVPSGTSGSGIAPRKQIIHACSVASISIPIVADLIILNYSFSAYSRIRPVSCLAGSYRPGAAADRPAGSPARGQICPGCGRVDTWPDVNVAQLVVLLARPRPHG